jgi:hypothetical protein
MCIIPYELLNEILKNASLLQEDKWYMQIDTSNGHLFYKYNIKNRFIKKISDNLVIYKKRFLYNVYVSIFLDDESIFSNDDTLLNKSNLIILYRNSEYNYMYLILQNNKFIFVKCYYDKTEKGLLLDESGLETKINSFKLYMDWQINMTVYSRFALCKISI